MANEIFNYNSVKTKMDELQTVFDNFSKDLNDLNIQIESKIDQNAMSAIFGNAAAAVKKTWDENSASFSSFKDNFEQWSQLVATVSINNLTFEANAHRTINGEDKITSSELLNAMGYTTVEVPSANGEEVFETKQIDPYGDLSTLTGAQVAADTNSVLDNLVDVKGDSLVQPGDSMTLTSGSKLSFGNEEYSVVGFATEDNSGRMCMWLQKGNAKSLYYVYADENGVPVMSNSVTTSNYPSNNDFTHLVTINPGWCVTALAAPEDASYYEMIVSNQYISKTSQVVRNNDDVVRSVVNNESFVMEDGKMLVENDYLNSDINSSVFYNPYFDYMNGNSTSGTDGGRYYIDSNNDGFVTIYEDLNTSSGSHSIERAFEKVQERGDNDKKIYWTDQDILDVLDTPSS